MRCDTLIRNARVIDGSGNPYFFADVALTDDRIAAVVPPGRFPVENADRTIDATGKIVCPGFIDIQSHSLAPYLTDGRGLSKVTQGVTSEILGELWTPAPFGGRRESPWSSSFSTLELDEEARGWRRFGDWIGTYEKRGVATNIGSFVGGATVREYACGWDASPADAEQTALIRRVTEEAMEDGAFGIAPALIYPPDCFSTDEQLTASAEVVGRYGGIYIVHLRSEGDTFLESLEATIRLSVEAKCAVEVYHFKASGRRNWPKFAQAIERIDRARAEGVDITADMYPYPASGTGLSVLIPLWASEGGRLFENLRDPVLRERIRQEMLYPTSNTGDFSGDDAEGRSRAYTVLPLGFREPENRRYLGKRLSEIAEERGQDWATAAIELLLSENQRIATVFFSMSEENVRLGLRQPWVKVSTDAAGLDPTQQTTPGHPRGFGTYPRVLGKYVREEQALTWEDAIRKMTSSVADRLRLKQRGLLKEGYFADVVVFDPATVADRATFTDPHRFSVGIEHVFVNGVPVVRDSVPTNALPGRTLRL
ncbi:MAG: D-aminoacylase [Capsulimonadales bacterium]|nr:D-aminoacylase [Capsulimonadales bacterium]